MNTTANPSVAMEVPTCQIALFQSLVLSMHCHRSINTTTCISEKWKGGRISKDDVARENRQSRPDLVQPGRPHWKVANGCWGLIDCFASEGGAARLVGYDLGTWNKVNEVTTRVVATRQTWPVRCMRHTLTCSSWTLTSWDRGGFGG